MNLSLALQRMVGPHTVTDAGPYDAAPEGVRAPSPLGLQLHRPCFQMAIMTWPASRWSTP